MQQLVADRGNLFRLAAQNMMSEAKVAKRVGRVKSPAAAASAKSLAMLRGMMVDEQAALLSLMDHASAAKMLLEIQHSNLSQVAKVLQWLGVKQAASIVQHLPSASQRALMGCMQAQGAAALAVAVAAVAAARALEAMPAPRCQQVLMELMEGCPGAAALMMAHLSLDKRQAAMDESQQRQALLAEDSLDPEDRARLLEVATQEERLGVLAKVEDLKTKARTIEHLPLEQAVAALSAMELDVLTKVVPELTDLTAAQHLFVSLDIAAKTRLVAALPTEFAAELIDGQAKKDPAGVASILAQIPVNLSAALLDGTSPNSLLAFDRHLAVNAFVHLSKMQNELGGAAIAENILHQLTPPKAALLLSVFESIQDAGSLLAHCDVRLHAQLLAAMEPNHAAKLLNQLDKATKVGSFLSVIYSTEYETVFFCLFGITLSPTYASVIVCQSFSIGRLTYTCLRFNMFGLYGISVGLIQDRLTNALTLHLVGRWR
jgi:Mg/Co/Ni transporter MgtE